MKNQYEIDESAKVAMTKLMPCPFCGGEAEMIMASELDEDGEPETWIYAECQTCKARSKSVEVNTIDEGVIAYMEIVKSANEAAELWNRRVKRGTENKD